MRMLKDQERLIRKVSIIRGYMGMGVRGRGKELTNQYRLFLIMQDWTRLQLSLNIYEFCPILAVLACLLSLPLFVY